MVLLEDDGPTVEFLTVGITMKITKCSWFAYEQCTPKVIVGRQQIPLKLVTTKEGLSVTGFLKKMLIKKHPKVCNFYETIINRPALSNCICCNNQECPITISEGPELLVHEIDDDLCSDSLSHEELSEIEKCCQQMLQDDSKDDSQDESPCESHPNIECLRNSNAQALPIGLM